MNERSSELGKKFYLLDLDRCMLDTELAAKIYSEVIRENDPELAQQMIEEQQMVEDNGESFDLLDFLTARIGEAEIDAMSEMFIQKANEINLLNPGALQLLHDFDEHEADYGILTYGHKKWQTVKLRASKLDRIPYFITPEKHKGLLMRSWLQEDGRFIIPPELLIVHEELPRNDKGEVDTSLINLGERAVFDFITQTDDKAVSFADIPDQVDGYWYQKEEKLLPSQMGDVPNRIRVVRHLAQVAEFEFDPALSSAA